jgi:hypothetical protein
MMMSPASQGRAVKRQSSREFTCLEIAEHVHAAIQHAAPFQEPWQHWQLANVFPAEVFRELARLPLTPASSEGPSGRREYRNEQRVYFDRINMARFSAMRGIAKTMRSPAVASAVHKAFSAPIDGTFLRIEYAPDTDGFWLEPHTDIGVKKFTCFVYLDGADNLGTDLYSDPQTFARRVPFIANLALAFVPGDNTWHGFIPRPIAGVRRSLIINYVGAEWRAREQLSFPDTPVRLAR